MTSRLLLVALLFGRARSPRRNRGRARAPEARTAFDAGRAAAREGALVDADQRTVATFAGLTRDSSDLLQFLRAGR